MNKPASTRCKLETARLRMQASRESALNSRVANSAAAFVLAVVLGGCGGGGGGGGSHGSQSPTYPTLSTATLITADSGVTANYAKTGNKLAQSDGTVSARSDSSTLAITVIVPPEPTFGFSVPQPATLLPLPANSPLDLVTCMGCLLAGTVRTAPIPAGEIVSFMYLKPSAAALTYSTLGSWSKPPASTGPDIGAAFSIGVVTGAQDLPISGTPTYKGFMVGRYADGTNTYLVGANVSATVTFNVSGSNRISSVTFITSDTLIARESSGALGVETPSTPLGLTLTSKNFTYDATSNLLSGTLTAPAIIGSGVIRARYYGPPTGTDVTPAELGGAFFIGDSSKQMNGSFALKKQ